MKTLADFKRRIKVGQLIETIHEKFGSFGVRPISKVQSNSFALLTEKYADKGEPFPDGPKDSWCQFPKASEIKFPDSDTAEIYWNDNGQLKRILTYKFITK